MDRLREDEETLREACYLEDFEKVRELVEAGTNLNSTNKVNKWTALHWAVSRNNAAIVDYLLSRGADRNIENDKGEKPFNLSSSLEVDNCFGLSKQESKNGNRSGEFNLESIENKYGFIPNFIKYPQSLDQKRAGERYANNQLGKDVNRSREICIKARVAEAEEKDFIELEIDLELCSYAELKSLLCQELHITSDSVKKIRKLPNVIVRNDRDIKRLREGSEIELVVDANT